MLLAAVLVFLLGLALLGAERAEEKTEAVSTVFSEKEDHIYELLRKKGYTVAGASGILGNIAVENPRFEADLYANGGNTYGLFQWTNDGNRRDNLVQWCNGQVLYPNRIEGQIAFAIHELEGGDPIACRANAYLKKTADPEMAAMEFAVGFERCIGATQKPEDDGIYTGSLYPEHEGDTYQALAKRCAAARKYYEGYKKLAAVGEKLVPRWVYALRAAGMVLMAVSAAFVTLVAVVNRKALRKKMKRLLRKVVTKRPEPRKGK